MKNRRNYNNSEVQKNVRFVRKSTASPAVESNCSMWYCTAAYSIPESPKKVKWRKHYCLNQPTYQIIELLQLSEE